MKAPKELNIRKGEAVKVVKPVYGMPESSMHWSKTLTDNHESVLGMEKSSIDSCLMVSKCDESIVGTVGIHVDGTFRAGTPTFLEREERGSSKFPSKPKELVTKSGEKFIAIEISMENGSAIMKQANYIANIEKQKVKNLTFEDFRSLRENLPYAAFSTVPNALMFVTTLAQFTEGTYQPDQSTVFKLLTDLYSVIFCKAAMLGIKYIHIRRDNTEVVLCVDAASAVSNDKSSQLGILVMLRDTENGNTNIIHYSSCRHKRVCKSVLASELLAIVDGSDVGFAVAHSLEGLLEQVVPLTVYSDIQSLLGLFILLSQTTEQRLRIDLLLIKEAYENCEITNFV